MIYIAVCEDDKEQQKKIDSFIKKYAEVNCCDFSISFFDREEDFWEQYEVEKFNIVFLDIYLEATNGIEIAKRLRSIGAECAIVFITSSRNHAVEGFELKAQHYLIKPVIKEQIFEALNRCEKIIANDMKHISLPNGKLENNIRLKDIIYIEVFDKISIVHTVTENFKTYLSLSQLEQQLGGSPFLRCHRCSIINMNYVIDYSTDDFIMKNGDAVSIRKSGNAAIRQEYLNYIFMQVRGENGD